MVPIIKFVLSFARAELYSTPIPSPRKEVTLMGSNLKILASGLTTLVKIKYVLVRLNDKTKKQKVNFTSNYPGKTETLLRRFKYIYEVMSVL